MENQLIHDAGSHTNIENVTLLFSHEFKNCTFHCNVLCHTAPKQSEAAFFHCSPTFIGNLAEMKVLFILDLLTAIEKSVEVF